MKAVNIKNDNVNDDCILVPNTSNIGVAPLIYSDSLNQSLHKIQSQMFDSIKLTQQGINTVNNVGMDIAMGIRGAVDKTQTFGLMTQKGIVDLKGSMIEPINNLQNSIKVFKEQLDASREPLLQIQQSLNGLVSVREQLINNVFQPPAFQTTLDKATSLGTILTSINFEDNLLELDYKTTNTITTAKLRTVISEELSYALEPREKKLLEIIKQQEKRNLSLELKIDELSKYIKKGFGEFTIKKMDYRFNEAKLLINNYQVKFHSESNTTYLLKVLFENQKSMQKLWGLEELVNKIGVESKPEPANVIRRIVYRINDRIKTTTNNNVDRFLLLEHLVVFINPKYLQ